MGAPPSGQLQSQAEIVSDILGAIQVCIQLFIQAESEERISFDNEVVPTSFQIISDVTSRAALWDRDRLDEYLHHLQIDGPEACEALIQRTMDRLPPILHRDDLLGLLIKPPSA